jgi:hypothetical protein
MAPAARASQRPRTERTTHYSAARAVRTQVNTPPGGACTPARRLVNGKAKMELPIFQVKPH